MNVHCSYICLQLHAGSVECQTCFLCALQNSKLSVKWGLYLIPFDWFDGILALDVICKLHLI